jgi:polyhydroxyalkanoate synthesis regulator phasin
MANTSFKWLALLGGVALGSATMAVAQDSGALLDALVRKGVLNDQEAEEIRADLVRDFGSSSAGKVDLSSSISKFKLSGDMRIREQFETQSKRDNPATLADESGPSNERTRTRLRFRLNGDFTLQQGWGAGFALETAQASDSGNQTLQGGADDYGIYLAKAFVSYTNDDLYLVAGKQKNEFYTTDLVWDADINPQGFFEQYAFNLGKDTTFTLRAGQFLMQDQKESVGAGTNNVDAWMFYQQAELKQVIGAATVKVAPGFLFYNASTMAANDAAVPAPTNESAYVGTNENLQILLLPGEVSFKDFGGAGHVLKVYADMAYNTQGDDRVNEAYYNGAKPASVDEDPLAWLVGVSYGKGQGKAQGDWKLAVDYREIGLGSIDPNINDSDFAFSRLNQKGFKFGASYNLADFASLNLTYFLTEELQQLPGAGLSDAAASKLADLDHSRTCQIDLNIKF